MDHFIDKLAQKIGGTDIIKANVAAETKELQMLKAKTEDYEKLLQELRELNLKNIESSEKLSSIIDSIPKQENQTYENRAYMEELLDKTSDLVHKENVKVYRNVQAAVKSELESQTISLIAAQRETEEKIDFTFLKIMSVLIFVAVLADIALRVLGILGII